MNRILLAYDGSPESMRALERAAEQARATAAEVTVVSVAEPIYRTPPYTGYADPAEERRREQLLADARGYLAERGVAVQTRVLVGDAADAVVAAARDADASLLVVGSRERGLLRRLLLGSVSGELLVEAPCDVLVVR